MIGRQQKEKKKTWKISLFLFIIILMTTIIGVCVVAQYQSEQYADNVLRLHVIANSNTSEDQALKLKVRDSVGSVVSMLTKNTRTAAETEQIVQENIDIIKTVKKAIIIQLKLLQETFIFQQNITQKAHSQPGNMRLYV